MLHRIILFVLCLASSAFAGTAGDSADYVTNFPIFVYGDVSSIETAFIFVQKLLDSGATIDSIIAGISFILVAFTGWGIFKRGSTGFAVPTAFYLMFGLMSLEGGLNVTMHIEDQRAQIDYSAAPNMIYAKVEDIPFPIAVITSSSSTVSDALMRVVEDASATVNTNKASFAALGFAGAYDYAAKMKELANFNRSAEAKAFQAATKKYIETCVIYYGTENNNDIGMRLQNPQVDIFDMISPTALGITNTTVYTFDWKGTETNCNDFWNANIVANYATVATEFKDTLGKVTKTNPDAVLTHIANVTHASTASTIASANQNVAYMMNAAIIPVVEKALSEGASGTDMSDAINAATAKANIQDSGLGQFRWMAQILPFAFHFYLGIIYAISVLVMIVAIALGIEKGMAIIANYAQGLFAFEFTKVAFAYVNNVVNSYAENNAYAAITGMANPATLDYMQIHTDYLATMTGIAGLLGVGAVLMIPTMIFTGKVAMAAGALGGLSSYYKGGSDAARGTYASAVAQETAYQKALEDAHKNGLKAPANMGEGSFYSKYQSDIDSLSKGFSAGLLGQSTIESAAHGAGMQSMGQLTSLSHIANNTTAGQHIVSGAASGAMQVGQIEATNQYVDKYGTDSLRQGSKIQGIKSLNATRADSEMSESQAELTSYASASMKNLEAIEQTGANIKAGLLDENGRPTPLVAQSMRNNFDVKAAQMAGIGRNQTASDERLDFIARQSSGQYQEQFSSAEGYVKRAMTGDNLKQEYTEAVKGAAESKVASMIEATKGFGSAERQADFAGQSSFVKSQTDAKVLQNQLQQAGMSKEAAEDFGKNAGEAFNKAVSTMANTAGTMAGGKLAADMATIKEQGGAGGYIDTQRKNAALNASLQAGLTQKKWENINDEDFIKNQMESLKAEGLDLTSFKDGDKWKTGTAYMNALGASQARKQTMKESIVDDNGRTVDFAVGTDGSVKKLAIDGEQKINEGRKVDRLNSNISGNKDENFDDYNMRHKGDHLDYDFLIDTVGNDKIGEIAKGVLTGATVLGALDVVTGGKVKERITDAVNQFREYKNQRTGKVNGQGDDGKSRTFDPNNPLDVDEYLDNNKGAKSRVNYENLSRSDIEGREPSGPKYPHNAAPTQSTANTTAAQNNADAINTPPEKSSNNQIIPENQEGVNTKNNNFRQTAMDRYLTEKQTALDLSNNKDLAEFNRLESYKGKDLESLSDMEKNKLGLDSNAFNRIDKIEDGIAHFEGARNAMNAPDSKTGFFESRINAAKEAMDTHVGWKTKAGLVASALILGSQNETFANVLNAIDPMQMIMGQELGKGSDVIPQGGTHNNLRYINDPSVNAFFMGQTAQVIAQDGGQMAMQVSQQVQNSTASNLQALQSNQPAIHTNSVSGNVTFGSSNDGFLRVTTPDNLRTQTQIPFSQFNMAMQNPQFAQQFAGATANADFGGLNPNVLSQLQSMPNLMEELNNRAVLQEFQFSNLSRNTNSLMGYSDEIVSRMEEMEDMREMIEAINGKN